MIKHVDNEHVSTLSHYKQKVKVVNEKNGQVHYKNHIHGNLTTLQLGIPMKLPCN